MQARDVAAFGAGALAGIAVVTGIWAATRPAADDDAATPPPTTTTTRPVWVSALEARIGPSVVFPTEIEVSNGEMLVAYEVRNVLAAGDGRDGTHAAAAPARWTLIGPDFEVTQEVVAPSSRGVRFQVPAGFSPDLTTVLRLDAYWLAAGVEFPLAIDPAGASWHPIGPGLQARLVDVIDQAENSIVIVEVDGPQSLTGDMTIDGAGREWVSSSRSMLGSHRWTLDYRGEGVPDPIPLLVRGVQWFEIPAALELELGPILP